MKSRHFNGPITETQACGAAAQTFKTSGKATELGGLINGCLPTADLNNQVYLDRLSSVGNRVLSDLPNTHGCCFP